MSDLNSYSFTGRLGNNAELKFAQSGTAIWTASVAVGYGWGDNKGTNWIRVKAFGKRAEGLGKLDLQKGAQVGGAGELQVREYERNDGTKGTFIEVTVNDLALLGGKPQGNTSSSGPRGGAPARERPARATDAPADDFQDSDIPFLTNRANW